MIAYSSHFLFSCANHTYYLTKPHSLHLLHSLIILLREFEEHSSDFLEWFMFLGTEHHLFSGEEKHREETMPERESPP